MKVVVKKIVLFMLCLILCGCGKMGNESQVDDVEEKEQVAMGRYLEEAAGIDDLAIK